MNKENHKVQKRKRKSNKLIGLFLLLIGLITLFIGYRALSDKESPNNNKKIISYETNKGNKAPDNPPSKKESLGDKNSEGQIKIENPKKSPQKREFRIKAAGDVLYHGSLIEHGKKQGGGEYVFSDQYALIKDFMTDADYTIANFEGTHNPNRKYKGYPMFNSPKELIYELKKVGFDGLTTANNHSLDTGYEGVLSTIKEINKAGINSFGSQKDIEDKIKIVDVDGIKLTVLAYTDSLNGLDYLLDTKKKKESVNKIDLESDNIKNDIKEARKMGADIVIIYPHWGDEFTSTNRPEYVKLARNMIEWGADAVCGNHPHVVQPSEWYTSKNGRKGFIIYSMGNFISNQVKETIDDYRVEQSVVLELIFDIDPEEKASMLKEVKFHPTWLKRTKDDYNGFLHQPVLAKDYMDGGPMAHKLNNKQLKRATNAYNKTMKTLESPVQ